MVWVFPESPEKQAPGPARPGSVNVCVLEQSFFTSLGNGKIVCCCSFGRNGQNWSELILPGRKVPKSAAFRPKTGRKVLESFWRRAMESGFWAQKAPKRGQKGSKMDCFRAFEGRGGVPGPAFGVCLPEPAFWPKNGQNGSKTGQNRVKKRAFFEFWAAVRPKTQSNRPRRLQVWQKGRKSPFLHFRGGLDWGFVRG